MCEKQGMSALCSGGVFGLGKFVLGCDFCAVCKLYSGILGGYSLQGVYGAALSE